MSTKKENGEKLLKLYGIYGFERRTTMTKIQIIIDDEKSLKGITCTGISTQEILSDDEEWSLFERPRRTGVYQFAASNVIFDESPQLISIPDELLLRIRDYNIDIEHKYAIEQTLELKEKIESLKEQVIGWELRRDMAIEEYEKFHKTILNMIDRYHMAAAELCLQEGNLDAACYYANKAQEENGND